MALQSMTALASITLQEASSSVTFSGIPQNYRDLVIVAVGTMSTNNIDISIDINSDSNNSNYSRVDMSGTTSGTTASFTVEPRRITGWGYWGNDQVSNCIVQIMDYSVTDKHKTLLARANRQSSGLDAISLRWANTAAITSIALAPTSSTFAAGSTFNLYGRIA